MTTFLAIDEQVSLRTLCLNDAPAFFELVKVERGRLEEFLAWVPRVQTLQDVEGVLMRAAAMTEAGTAARFGIFDQDRLFGTINLFVMAPGYSAEFGIWLSATTVGKGIANRAARTLFAYARDTMGLKRIQFRLRPDNHQSRAFITRLGLVFEGVELHAEEHHGVWHNLERYALLL